MGNSLDIYIYLRKSRADNASDPIDVTLRRHRKTLEQYAEEQGYNVLGVYEEVVSGDTLYARPEMLHLLDQVEAGACDAVLVMDLDRLSRGSMRDQGTILDAFRLSGTLIITPEKTYDLSDETDEELTEFKAFFARREYKIITKRMQRGVRRTIQDGGYIANAPFGYKKVRKGKLPTLEVDETEAPYVRMIFDLYTQGIGTTTIADTLNSLGIKPHRAEQFGRTSVMHILKNPVFTGKIVWDRKKHVRKGAQGNAVHVTIYQPEDRWTVTEGKHEAIISEEQFQLAQQIMKNRYIPSKRKTGVIKNPLVGLVYCSGCGKLMQRMGEANGVPYLLCNTKGCVAGAQFRFVEESVLQFLRQTLSDLQARIASKKKPDIKPLESVIQMAQKTEEELIKQKNSLHDLLEQGVYDVSTFKERTALLNQRMAENANRQAEAQKRIQQLTKQYDKELAKRIKNVLDAYQPSDPAKRNQLLKSVIDRIDYYKKKKTSPTDFTLSITLKMA